MTTGLIKELSRRDFLKFSALALSGSMIDLRSGILSNLVSQIEYSSRGLLGRVFKDETASHSEPSITSQKIGNHNHNDILAIVDTTLVKNGQPINTIWYRLEDKSFIKAHDVQIVANQLNAPQTEISSKGVLGEVTVPFTDAWNSSVNGKKANQIFFYGSTHWVYGLGKDDQKNLYYLVKEDRWNDSYYVDATHMRIFQDDELLPISELVPLDDKRIRINLKEQVLVAYEKKVPVFMSACASGELSGDINLTTPQGTFDITYKRPSRHMAHSDRIGANGAELYGVPWVSYFTETGIAFHGTYWHNNFTQPRSHGCINLPISAARWIYLWTQPIVPPREEIFVSRYGTQVEVI